MQQKQQVNSIKQSTLQNQRLMIVVQEKITDRKVLIKYSNKTDLELLKSEAGSKLENYQNENNETKET